MIRGEFLKFSVKQLQSEVPKYDFSSKKSIAKYDRYPKDLLASESFREKCMEAGFIIQKLYPVYFQGWECDCWGAIGTKDGKEYVLETNHGGLIPLPLKSVKESTMKVLIIKTKK